MNRMSFNRKKVLIFNSVTMILLCTLFVVVFAPLCLFSHHDADIDTSDNCLFSAHSFTYQEDGLSAFFILPFLGVFFLISNLIIPEGLILSPYRPPRLHF
jgi:hypothetical protein